MSTENPQQHPTFLAQADGTLALNQAGIELQTRYRQVKAEHDALDASWAGAFLARLFAQHAWLDAVRLSFAVSAEYDDSGGYFRSISCHILSACAVPQHPLPEELLTEGEFDSDTAEQIVEQEIEDSEFDLYTCLSETPSGYDDLDLTLERKPIAELLCASPIDGHAAFRAWGLGQATTR
ncbi:MAG TPA: hypothetical protein DET46_01005 [Comamonadaceae bacterium]|jgi:hypothetical protein|uniref:hypothetical protein n=1 Tax=unclassified Acidovorax TaxID=2684926 RepID=UPI0008AC93BF|nr:MULTISPECIES: hypothetical protein [unclassified Acidovorax]MCL4769703.1 hypothetical protein [Burkholderiaceae bacterium]OGB48474.1 MAG: hypothetical protein A3F76_05480 [Burkholderiales bacterium RIFCSPLOWO2_12_FULL_65_40]HCE27552.1 hypothetical protein [Comamonadaceae bacterium]NCU66816.1 hypothetical protein [Acidovorax sp. 210-6]PTT39456.1 hypothetical protein DBR23_10970 [Acidovorax sp. HMWF018]